MRFAIYGALFGLIAGVPLGVGMSTRGWRLPAFLVSGDVATARLGDRAASDGDHRNAFNLDGLLEPADHIMHGGPAKDGIPSLLDPATVVGSGADFLSGEDRIVGVTIGGDARAYPIRLLNYHEIVNDELGGVPIAVVYCPLCDSVSVVDRRMDGETLSFGVSGLLLHSNVLMYDRAHDALWTQVGCRAISGPLAGQSLTHINSWELTSFATWSDQHPRGDVVSFETGYDRDYLRSPYARYFENDELYFPVPRDDRLRQKAPVIGVRIGSFVCAVPVEAVERAPGGRLEVAAGDHRVTLASGPGDGSEITVIDAPEGAEVVHTFWFAWAAFHPGTSLLASEPTTRPGTGP